MKVSKRTSKDEGIYAVYWKVDEDKGGYRSVETLSPRSAEAPNEVKLMILKCLLDDLKIPISIEEHMIRNGYEK